MTKFRQVTITEGEDGFPVSYLAIEGAANDVAVYGLAGEHDDADLILRIGAKVTERRARSEGISWPVRLTYRR